MIVLHLKIITLNQKFDYICWTESSVGKKRDTNILDTSVD